MPQAEPPLARHFGAGRLRVSQPDPHTLAFHDRLLPGRERRLASAAFAGLHDGALARELLRRGFTQGSLAAALRPIAAAADPARERDLHFWQFPARTEAAAFELHRPIEAAHPEGDRVHVYLGLPWATWVDHRGLHRQLPPEVEHELLMQRVRIQGLRRAWAELGRELRVHTVCQHIHWRRLAPAMAHAGITDLWLSHAPATERRSQGGRLALHPWHLHAVNVEDPARQRGLAFGTDPADKPLLASFIGAQERHYINDTRLRLRELAGQPAVLVEVTDRWHFHEVVYGHQMRGAALPAGPVEGDTVERYNRVLSDSVFSLCPPGAGANTIRLWESLAIGSVPVVFEPLPTLLRAADRGVPAEAWRSAVVVAEGDSPLQWLEQLRRIPLPEVRRMAKAGRALYETLRSTPCFGTLPGPAGPGG